MDSFLRLLEIVGTADLLIDNLKEGKNALDYISFESEGNFKGIGNLKTLLFATKNHRKISFEHENYETGISNKYILSPYLIKEYQSRWYIVGLLSGMDELRTFGVDRINDLQLLTQTFKYNAKVNAKKMFEDVVGLTYSLNKKEEVLISFTPLQAKYLKALPFHKSQEIVSENKKEVIIKLEIIPNFELKQKLVSLGNRAKVIKPKWFADDIKNELKKALERY